MRLLGVNRPARHHFLIIINFKNVMKVVKNFSLTVLSRVDVINQVVAKLDDVVAEVNVAVNDRTVAGPESLNKRLVGDNSLVFSFLRI